MGIGGVHGQFESATAANGQATAYTLTVNNAAAPNTNSLQSVSVAVPAQAKGTPSGL